MNKVVKRILLGSIIWAIPFVASMLVWDMEANTSKIGMPWFNALMAFTWAVGFAIAVCLYFKSVKKSDAVSEGWITGITWYVELLIIDLLVLVIAFGMAMTDFYPMILTYINAIAISAAIGYIMAR
jgi:hypothetical protein